jgi:cytochrome c551
MHARSSSRFRRGAALLLVFAIALAVSACGSSNSGFPTGTAPTASTSTGVSTTTTAATPAAADGASVFSNNCSICHGQKGEGGNGGPNIQQGKTDALVMHQVTNGGGGMPAFGSQLTPAEIQAVAKYVSTTLQTG